MKLDLRLSWFVPKIVDKGEHLSAAHPPGRDPSGVLYRLPDCGQLHTVERHDVVGDEHGHALAAGQRACQVHRRLKRVRRAGRSPVGQHTACQAGRQGLAAKDARLEPAGHNCDAPVLV